MGNEKNLIKPGDRTPEERRESARKAGQASGRARRAKKSFREAARWLLSMEIDGQALDGQPARLTVYESLVISLVQQAQNPECKTSLQAFQQLQELVGESPRMQEVDIKRQELEIKKQAQEADSW